MKRLAICGLILAIGCGGDDVGTPGDTNEEELITTVVLSFSPVGGGADVIAVFDDPDGDGGQAPTVDGVELSAGTDYTLTVGFENRLSNPTVDIGEEIAEEAEEHQIFLTGTAVNGPATTANASAILNQSYADTESDYGADETGEDLPVGLVHQVSAQTGSAGTLIVTLRHLPPINGQPVKSANLADDVAASGIGSLPGATDASVTFSVTVP